MKHTFAPHYYFVAGEPSGDLHGGKLLQALKKAHEGVIASGVGGPCLREEQLQCILRMEDFEVMGLSDVLKALPKLWKQFRTVRDHILKTRPDVVILIDYPGFNLRLAKALQERGFQGKVVQYISPTIWAHSIQRIQHMAKTLDLLLTIYPFESPYFSQSTLRTEYIGNPLVEYIYNYTYDDAWMSAVGIEAGGELLSLFPGSRHSEIRSHLPVLLKAAERLKLSHPNLRFAVSCARPEAAAQIEELIAHSSLKFGKEIFLVPKKYTYELMRDSQAAIAKSGTVTLELALHGCPTVVIYNLTWLNWLYAKLILRLRLRHYCIVNILEGREVFPELIKNGFSISEIAQQADLLLRPGICAKSFTTPLPAAMPLPKLRNWYDAEGSLDHF
jgi:lipid-A-disaccharide synthase